MTIHLMIDLETLSTSPRAAVMSLGYTVFDTGIIEKGGWVVNLASSIMAGGEIDADTIAWWQKQDQDAVRAVTHGGVHIYDVMSGLSAVAMDKGVERVWSHGATFDIPIVEFYMRTLGVDQPWRYSDHRDTRTLFELAQEKGWEKPKRSGIAHRATDDALYQTVLVMGALRALS